MHGRAFFLSPKGKLIRVGTSHIAEVIRHPEEFGLSLEEIEKAYRKYGEKLGTEGKARGEILSRIIQEGWIRVKWGHIPFIRSSSSASRGFWTKLLSNFASILPTKCRLPSKKGIDKAGSEE